LKEGRLRKGEIFISFSVKERKKEKERAVSRKKRRRGGKRMERDSLCFSPKKGMKS